MKLTLGLHVNDRTFCRIRNAIINFWPNPFDGHILSGKTLCQYTEYNLISDNDGIDFVISILTLSFLRLRFHPFQEFASTLSTYPQTSISNDEVRPSLFVGLTRIPEFQSRLTHTYIANKIMHTLAI